MCSNGGNRKIAEEGNWPGVGQAYLDEKALTNIVSQSEAIKRGYRVTFDSEIENTFIVTDRATRVTTRYPCDERGLYVREHQPPLECHVAYINATSIEGFTQREVERAGRARKLYHDLGAENI